jgi:hypothetical protein
MKQDEHCAMLGTQSFQSLQDGRPQLGGLILFPRVSPVRQILHGMGPKRAAPEPCAATVDRNADDPRLQGPLLIPAPQTAEDPDKNLLGHILCVMPTTQQAATETVHERVVPLY